MADRSSPLYIADTIIRGGLGVGPLAFNKVFKPQYVLWVIPFLAWIRASRVKVRILETTAIVQFAVIYFALPEIIYVAETGVRLVILFLLCIEIIRSGFAASVLSET